MAEKVKRPPFFTLKRWQSTKENRKNSLTPTTPTPSTQPQDNPPLFRSNNSAVSRTINFNLESKSRKPSRDSAGGIKELVQCSLCLEVLHNPKMLPCQHTFCTACLSVYIADLIIFDCPICRTRVQVLGPNFVENLPSNLYIDSLLQLVGVPNGNGHVSKNSGTPPTTPPVLISTQNVDLLAAGTRCVHCKSVCDNLDITQCDHCKLKFCRVCWSQHLEDMRIQLKSIVKQLDTAASHLEHKIEHYKDRCDRIAEQIKVAGEEKIATIYQAKDKMLMEAANLQKSSEMSALALQTSLEEAKLVANVAMESSSSENENDRSTKENRKNSLTPTTPTPSTQPQDNPPLFRSNNSAVSRTINFNLESKSRKPSRDSAGGIKELVQCSLCLEVLHNPKMLPCQHTFCTACLSVYIADLIIFDCPICRTRVQVLGPNFVENLPSNLYIDSLLQLVGVPNGNGHVSKNSGTPPTTPPVLISTQNVDLLAAGTRCVHCKSVCDNLDITQCDHCKLKFCRVCWSQHLEDMRIQLKSIVKQLDTAASHLEHKIEHYKDRCDRIAEQIKVAGEEKIATIYQAKDKMLMEAANLQKSSEMSALALQTSLEEAKLVANVAMESSSSENENDRVATFINLHKNAISLLSEVSKWDTERFVFDKENFTLEMDSAAPLESESDDPVLENAKQNDPLESEESLVLHYRSRSFIPHFVWRKSYRPCGVGVSPWSNYLYVCGMDSHNVLVIERAQAKIITRLSCDEMLCPVQIAFMKSLGEVYVTDKWKHCIHVFYKDGEYLRSIGQKGSRVGTFRSPEGIATDNANQLIYVVDTGNDRVQIIQPDGKYVDQIGVTVKHQAAPAPSVWETEELLCTELNAPTSVAVTNDRVVILDSGNGRIKLYNKQDKSKIIEFGSMGQRKGQFRHPEVLAVDPMGYILVGDSGNCRVQVFKPTGQLIRVFGGLGSQPGKFGWISGIHVTKQLDIIISDTKNHSVNFF